MVTAQYLALLTLVSAAVKLPFHKIYNAPNTLSKRSNYGVDINGNGLSYIAEIEVGTPAQTQHVLIDTGSSDTWFATPDTCNTDSSGQATDGGDPVSCDNVYAFSDSSTFKNLTTPFYIEYGDESVVEGYYAQDTLSVGGATIEGANIAFATVTSDESIMGIGFMTGEACVTWKLTTDNQIEKTDNACTPYENLPQQLKTQGKISSTAYSVWLNDLSTPQGNLLFGGVDHAKYRGQLYSFPIDAEPGLYNKNGGEIPLYPKFTRTIITLNQINVYAEDGSSDILLQGAIPALLDTGSTQCSLPSALIESFAKVFGAKFDGQVYYVDCGVSQNAWIGFNFRGVEIQVPLRQFLRPYHDVYGNVLADADSKIEYCSIGASSSDEGYFLILGDNVLSSFYSVYDLENGVIALAPAVYNVTDSNIEDISGSIPGAVEAPAYSQSFSSHLIINPSPTVTLSITPTTSVYGETASVLYIQDLTGGAADGNYIKAYATDDEHYRKAKITQAAETNYNVHAMQQKYGPATTSTEDEDGGGMTDIIETGSPSSAIDGIPSVVTPGIASTFSTDPTTSSSSTTSETSTSSTETTSETSTSSTETTSETSTSSTETTSETSTSSTDTTSITSTAGFNTTTSATTSATTTGVNTTSSTDTSSTDTSSTSTTVIPTTNSTTTDTSSTTSETSTTDTSSTSESSTTDTSSTSESSTSATNTTTSVPTSTETTATTSAPGVVTVTTLTTDYVTTCPESTTFTYDGSTYVVTEATTITVCTQCVETTSTVSTTEASSNTTSEVPTSTSSTETTSVPSVVTITTLTTDYVTTCPESTTFTYEGSTYVVTEATTITVCTKCVETTSTVSSESSTANSTSEVPTTVVPTTVVNSTSEVPTTIVPTTVVNSTTEVPTTEVPVTTTVGTLNSTTEVIPTTEVPTTAANSTTEGPTTVTSETTIFTTVCPEPTTFTYGSTTYTVTEATTLTITDCPESSAASEVPPTTVTSETTIFTTYCPEPTTLTYGSTVYTITEATTLTITSCPPDETTAAVEVPTPAPVKPQVETDTHTTTVFTTYCPEPTTLTYGNTVYTITEPTTLTVTSCPPEETSDTPNTPESVTPEVVPTPATPETSEATPATPESSEPETPATPVTNTPSTPEEVPETTGPVQANSASKFGFSAALILLAFI